MEHFAEFFARYPVHGMMNLFARYDQWLLYPDSRDLTTFSSPMGPHHLTTVPHVCVCVWMWSLSRSEEINSEKEDNRMNCTKENPKQHQVVRFHSSCFPQSSIASILAWISKKSMLGCTGLLGSIENHMCMSHYVFKSECLAGEFVETLRGRNGNRYVFIFCFLSVFIFVLRVQCEKKEWHDSNVKSERDESLDEHQDKKESSGWSPGWNKYEYGKIHIVWFSFGKATSLRLPPLCFLHAQHLPQLCGCLSPGYPT